MNRLPYPAKCRPGGAERQFCRKGAETPAGRRKAACFAVVGTGEMIGYTQGKKRKPRRHKGHKGEDEFKHKYKSKFAKFKHKKDLFLSFFYA